MTAAPQLLREMKQDGMIAYRATVHANLLTAEYGCTCARREIGIVTKRNCGPCPRPMC